MRVWLFLINPFLSIPIRDGRLYSNLKAKTLAVILASKFKRHIGLSDYRGLG